MKRWHLIVGNKQNRLFAVYGNPYSYWFSGDALEMQGKGFAECIGLKDSIPLDFEYKGILSFEEFEYKGILSFEEAEFLLKKQKTKEIEKEKKMRNKEKKKYSITLKMTQFDADSLAYVLGGVSLLDPDKPNSNPYPFFSLFLSLSFFAF